MRSFLAIDPLPCHILILKQNGNQQKEKKNLFLSLFLSVFFFSCHFSLTSCFACCITGCWFVFVLSEKLTRSQNEYENICIGVPWGATCCCCCSCRCCCFCFYLSCCCCCCSQSFSDLKFICHTEDDNLDGKWNMKLLCARQSFPGSCWRPLIVLNTSNKLKRIRANDLQSKDGSLQCAITVGHIKLKLPAACKLAADLVSEMKTDHDLVYMVYL